jgi:hypothetical protein
VGGEKSRAETSQWWLAVLRCLSSDPSRRLAR